jgi:hypothetical protein
MKLELFKTLWGHDGDLPSAIGLMRDAGFSGIEGPAPIEESQRPAFFHHLSGIPWIAEVTTCTPPGEYLPRPHQPVEAHLSSLDEGVRRSLPGKPRFITTMAGSDEWDFEDTVRFHVAVLDLQQKHGIAISVETHRGRPTFHPWLTKRLLEKLPDLRLTCDFSHWCVVSERLLLDREHELLDRCARHVHHIHGRVGYAQGPQVPDPRAPEYAAELDAHERWWDELWKAMRARGFTAASLTPEAGPDGYLHLMPFTQAPVAELWAINRWLGLRQLERFTNHE